jgi:hypothetical protein
MCLEISRGISSPEVQDLIHRFKSSFQLDLMPEIQSDDFLINLEVIHNPDP